MRQLLWVLAFLAYSVLVPVAKAQNVEVNRQNRTVAVTVTDTVEAEPEIAVVQVGYHNFGPTRDAAYKQNGESAQKIVDALISAGVKKEDIETNAVTLDRVDSEGKDWTPVERKERQYEAQQMWTVRVPPAEAQKAADQAIAAGANMLQNVDWIVRDLPALDAKAGHNALAKARALAEDMAQQFGAKVGALLFVSNDQGNAFVSARGAGGGMGNNIQTITVTEQAQPVLLLLPQKVRRDATVHAVFVLE
jgi:uncharacterized protein YggE